MDNWKYDDVDDEDYTENTNKKEVDYEKFFPDKYFERNVGLAKGFRFTLNYVYPIAVIYIVFSTLIAFNIFALTLGVLILTSGIFVFLSACNMFMGESFAEYGGGELIMKKAYDNAFSAIRLFIYLLVVSAILTLITKVKLESDNLTFYVCIYALIYYVDFIITRIIRYFKYETEKNQKLYKILDISELAVSIFALIAYGLVIFPLAPKTYLYQKIIYIVFIVILALVFSIVNYFIRKKKKEIDEIVYEEYSYNETKVFLFKLLAIFLLSIILIVICMMCSIPFWD